ncbi:YjfB family protein [Ectothiorhodospira sp. 9100]|uniref:YjfB family protein n=1 Tax=unclassified Ectothiorhodospira TaxID=2684909 RepID=UPI001EE85A58|nr:YjfB family protein [Ectothiorhodospira sp. 9100]MCG5519400.1 YjfB family protein [Ectothiorhodospira sp. 9905]
MEASAIANLSTQLSQQQTALEVGTAVTKKAIDAQAQVAANLVEALPDPGAQVLPANLGNNINVTA